MANQLDGSKRSNQIYELDSIRYLREEDAADIFGLPYSTVLCFAQAAGAVYQLPKITLIHRKQMEKYMNHLHKVPNTGKYVQKKFVRIGEGSITYSIGHHRFIEMANRMLHWSYTPEQKEEVKKALAAGVPKATILTYFYPEVTVEKMSAYRNKH